LLSLAPVALSAQARIDSTTRRDSVASLEAVTVSAIRARSKAPISATTIDAVEIERRSFGQDVPLLLQGTPSLIAHSETGTYWGYSYLRIRGIDQSRINFTIDGIPLNDPEDQVLYFADFPDLANSVTSIQVQRGVGSSAPGTASYGGSINFQTVPLVSAPRGLQLQAQGGSFGSARASLEYATGVTSSGIAAYGRVSALRSGGYRHHSGMEGRSGFLSAAHVGARHVLKLTGIVGLFADTLAYFGATRTELSQDRRFNPLRPDEVDRFGEQLVALSYSRNLASGTSASASVYRISANGNYNCSSQCALADGDVWNYHLDFATYGTTTTWQLQRENWRASVGAHASTYSRDHYAFERLSGQPESRLYFNTGHKGDASAFSKLELDVGDLTVFGDLQGRRAQFRYTPDANAGITPPSPVAWTFFNPKAGATLRLRAGLDAFASYGVNSREPARTDMLAGLDNLDATIVDSVGPFSRVRPERVHDAEAGVRFRGPAWSLETNVFAMEFRNEILPVGKLIYGYTPLRTNVRSSWRRGLEADLSLRPANAVELALTATAMRARIAEFTDDETGTVYRGVEPLLTPKFVGAHRLTLNATKALSFSAAGQYVSRAFLNNTGNDSLTVPAYYVANLSVDWRRGSRGVSLFLNNVANNRGFGSGHVSFGEPRYYVLPPLNALLLVRVGQ
jgi:iron complex outermembrane receptor protein